MSRLLDQLRETVRTRHYRIRAEEAYIRWAREYILFCGKRHPSELGAAGVSPFISQLAVRRKVAASTQTQALSALLLLYREVLALPIEGIDNVEHARKPKPLPVAFTREEARTVLARARKAERLSDKKASERNRSCSSWSSVPLMAEPARLAKAAAILTSMSLKWCARRR